MTNILENLRKCAAAYRAREEERVRKIKEAAAKRVSEPTKPRKKRTAITPEERKERMAVKKGSAKTALKEKRKDPHVEHAEKFIKGGCRLYIQAAPIPLDERAHCTTPWCMHNVNGHCVHRKCIIK